MWIVKSTQETALTLGDLDLEIPGQSYVDLDTLGRADAEASRDILNALQGGQLITVARSDLESEKLLEPGRGSELVEELAKVDSREEPPGLKSEFEAFRRLLEEFERLKDILHNEVTGLVSEFRRVKDGKPVALNEPVEPVQKRPKFTEADFRARTAIIDEIGREIKKNFDTIGSKIKKHKDRTHLVDKLKGL